MDNNVYGIDIAKKSFEVVSLNDRGESRVKSYSNTASGHLTFIGTLPPGSLCVMEASGSYYLSLAFSLHQHGIKLSVVNPLVIRRYSQMQLRRTKTDQQDARLIAHYGRDHRSLLKLWQPPAAVFLRLQQLLTSINLFQKQLQMLRNQLEAMNQVPIVDPLVRSEQMYLIEQLQTSIKRLEQQMLSLSKEHCSQSFQSLMSIPGIGPKTACLLIWITHDFRRFESAKQLVAYLGLCPRIFKSGSSVKGKESIVKMGQALARKYLYMGAFSAMKVNPLCQSMVESMKQKGKHHKVIRVAVAHKLLRQAFAVAKNQTLFNPDFI